jgi:hypothetical protein
MIVMMRPGRSFAPAGLLALTLFLPGCRNNAEPTPVDPGPTSGASTEFFTGTLSPGATQMYSFPVQQALNVKITLASLLQPGTNEPVTTPLTLLVGTSSDGANCAGTNTVTVSPSLTSHIDLNLPVAQYCVTVKDPGTLTGDVDFAVRVKLSLGTPIEGFAGTDSFSTNLYPGGVATRTFTVGQSSDVKITLNQVQPAASLAFGVGITKDLSECRFIQTTVVPKGASGEIVIRADPGAYCVRVYDPGNLGERVTFFMSIAHQ